jgi:DNA-binding PadR family transcriptional regulator
MLTYKRILVLLAVDILGKHDESYGNHVRDLIINTTGRHQSMYGGIYVHLHRLEELGYLQAWIGEKAPRKFYTVTALGLSELTITLNELGKLVETSRIILRKRGTQCNSSSRSRLSLVA